MLLAMKRFVAVAALLALAVSCKRRVDPAYVQEITDWQKKRAERLQAPDGWLSLVGLFWLQEGDNGLGSDRATNRVILPAKAPADAGSFYMHDGHVTLHARTLMFIDSKAVSATVPLVDDSDPKGPTVVHLGSILFQVIKRGPRYGVRVKDPQAETRTKFVGLEYFPIDSKWRVEAKFEPYEPPKHIPIDDVTGMTSDNISPGALVFELDDQEYRIDPILEEGSDELFIIIRDATSRDATYQAGRYLYAKKPGPDGKVIVDFNKLYNPPCAFTDFATCPLPIKENQLPVRIPAGELKHHP